MAETGTGVGGWLLLYLIGSLPVLAFYAAGLSGWFFNYPMPLFVGILLALLVPLVLLILKTPSAPAWNIGLVWAGAALILARILYGVLHMERALVWPDEGARMVVIIVFALLWAALWTSYFLVSERVARTFV